MKMPVASKEHQQEQIYCAEQINIPVTLPSILKDYVKAAIRTQPYDLLNWTAAYFRALANGELPPVKERLEYPPYVHSLGITPRFLKILLNQYRQDEDRETVALTKEKIPTTLSVKLESLLTLWRSMALKDTSLYQILMTGRLLEQCKPTIACDLYRFFAIACGHLGNNLYETMIYICELLTKEPDGGSAMISFKIFMNLYEYLADLDCSGGQSITAPGQINFERCLEGDEMSHSSFSSSTISSSSLKIGSSLTVKKTQAVRCESIDRSSKDTDTEESLCFSEVSCDRDDEVTIPGGTSREQTGVDGRIAEEASAKKPCGCNATAIQKTCASSEERMKRKERKSQLEPTSENSRYDSEKSFELKVPESSAERLSSGEAEVTRVQEAERRQSRDVEMHSRAEKVKLSVDDETKATGKSQLSFVASIPSPRDSASSSSKSHVVDASETTTREETMRQKFDQTDEILEARSSQFVREAGGADIVHAENTSVSSNPIENVPRDDKDSATSRNMDVEHFTMDSRMEDTNGEDEKIVRGSVESDYPATNEENDFIPSKRDHSQYKENRKISSKEHIVTEDKEVERLEETRLDREDYAGVEFIDVNESVDDEESEDMAKYETIDLENILEGICECLETTKDTGDLRSGSDTGQPSESSPASQPLDLVGEFIEKMRVTECPTGFYILPEVPGIGPPVSPETVTAVGLWLTEYSRRQQGQIGPRNLRHFMCPSLDGKPRYEDYAKMKNVCRENSVSVVDLKK